MRLATRWAAAVTGYVTFIAFWGVAPLLAACWHNNETIDGDVIWNSDCIHIVIGRVTVSPGASLTVTSGARVLCDDESEIRVYGTLDVLGGPGQEVLFTRRTEYDAWHGIDFESDSEGSLQYCTVEYSHLSGIAAGASITVDHCTMRQNYIGFNAWQVASAVSDCHIHDNEFGLSVRHVTGFVLDSPNTIEDNNGAGIWFDQSPGGTIANQTVTGHTAADGAIRMQGCGDFHLGTGNTITGNSWGLSIDPGSGPDAASAGNIPTTGNANEDGIQVFSSNALSSAVWRDLGVPYIFTGPATLDAEYSLVIEDGVEVRFDQDSSLGILGTLEVQGTAGEGVLFSRRDDLEVWRGLSLRALSSGTLRYCTIEYASKFSSDGVRADSASVNLDHCTLRYNGTGLRAIESSSVVSNCQVHNNATGIWIRNGADSDIAACQILDNDTGIEVWHSSVSVTRSSVLDNLNYGIELFGASSVYFGTFDSGNEIHGNGGGFIGREFLDFRNGEADVDVPYVYWGTLDEAQIEDIVYHEHDDPTRGRARYYPWTNAARDSLYWPPGTGVGGGEQPVPTPRVLQLAQNSPNPFNPVTEFRYGLPRDSWVSLELFDLAGRKVATIHEGFETAGFQSVLWNASDLSSGTYVYRLRAAGAEEEKKLVLIK